MRLSGHFLCFQRSFSIGKVISPHSETLKSQLQAILTRFDAPIRYAFAYGSGIFPQLSYPSAASTQHKQENLPMMDLIFGVTHPEHWHSLNLRQHPQHYATLMKSLGSPAITSLQRMGAGVYFHPYIHMDGVIIKYGVIAIDDLLNDLNDWSTFYMAGRMQKPVWLSLFISSTTNDDAHSFLLHMLVHRCWC